MENWYKPIDFNSPKNHFDYLMYEMIHSDLFDQAVLHEEDYKKSGCPNSRAARDAYYFLLDALKGYFEGGKSEDS